MRSARRRAHRRSRRRAGSASACTGPPPAATAAAWGLCQSGCARSLRWGRPRQQRVCAGRGPSGARSVAPTVQDDNGAVGRAGDVLHHALKVQAHLQQTTHAVGCVLPMACAAAGAELPHRVCVEVAVVLPLHARIREDVLVVCARTTRSALLQEGRLSAGTAASRGRTAPGGVAAHAGASARGSTALQQWGGQAQARLR